MECNVLLKNSLDTLETGREIIKSLLFTSFPSFEVIGKVLLPCLLSYLLSHVWLNCIKGVPGWLSQLSIQLRLRSWSHSSWVQAPRWALYWQLRAWSLLRIRCLPLSLCPSPTRAQACLCVSKINKHSKRIVNISLIRPSDKDKIYRH